LNIYDYVIRYKLKEWEDNAKMQILWGVVSYKKSFECAYIKDAQEEA